jgi:hypothetical protein
MEDYKARRNALYKGTYKKNKSKGDLTSSYTILKNERQYESSHQASPFEESNLNNIKI